MIIFDRTNQIRSLLNHGILFEEVKDSSVSSVLDKVHKYVKNGRADLIFGHIQMVLPPSLKDGTEPRDLKKELNKTFEELNTKLTDIYKDAQDDTGSQPLIQSF